MGIEKFFTTFFVISTPFLPKNTHYRVLFLYVYFHVALRIQVLRRTPKRVHWNSCDVSLKIKIYITNDIPTLKSDNEIILAVKHNKSSVAHLAPLPPFLVTGPIFFRDWTPTLHNYCMSLAINQRPMLGAAKKWPSSS